MDGLFRFLPELELWADFLLLLFSCAVFLEDMNYPHCLEVEEDGE